MSQQNVELESVVVASKRRRGSGPILILAGLFLASTFLAWYFTWFGRELSNADISQYLADTKNPRHVQHALFQVQQRMERGDPTGKDWYPQILALSGSSEAEFRLTVAWLMGFDNKNNDFHAALLRLLHDSEPIVRRNAALALVRFNDHSGREELLAVLGSYELRSTVNGNVTSTLREGADVARGSLLARIQQTDGQVSELRSPLPGKIVRIVKGNGSQVIVGDDILSINSDEESVWETLRGLALIGEPDDVTLVKTYESSLNSDRVRQQAQLTTEAIQQRATTK